MTEYWDAYDAKQQLIVGKILERENFPVDDSYHLAVNVWVRHEDGDFLFMRRSADKSHYPLYYEAGAGGSVLRGESSEQAAERELNEETGLSSTQLTFLFSFTEHRYQTHFDTYLAWVSGDKEAVAYQLTETDCHIWVSPQEMDAFLEYHLVFENQVQQLRHYLKETKEA